MTEPTLSQIRVEAVSPQPEVVQERAPQADEIPRTPLRSLDDIPGLTTPEAQPSPVRRTQAAKGATSASKRKAEKLKGHLGPGRPSRLKPEFVDRFVACIRAGNFISTSARLCGEEPGNVSFWLWYARKYRKQPYLGFLKQVEQAQAEYEAQGVQHLTAKMRLDPEYVLKYFRIRFPQRFAQREQITVRPGRPDHSQPEREEDHDTHDFGDLSTESVIDLYAEEFGEIPPEERQRIMALDQPGPGVQRPTASDLSGAYATLQGHQRRLLSSDEEGDLDSEPERGEDPGV